MAEKGIGEQGGTEAGQELKKLPFTKEQKYSEQKHEKDGKKKRS